MRKGVHLGPPQARSRGCGSASTTVSGDAGAAPLSCSFSVLQLITPNASSVVFAGRSAVALPMLICWIAGDTAIAASIFVLTCWTVSELKAVRVSLCPKVKESAAGREMCTSRERDSCRVEPDATARVLRVLVDRWSKDDPAAVDKWSCGSLTSSNNPNLALSDEIVSNPSATRIGSV